MCKRRARTHVSSHGREACTRGKERALANGSKWHLWTAMRTGRSRICILLAAWHAVSGVSPVIITSCDAATRILLR